MNHQPTARILCNSNFTGFYDMAKALGTPHTTQKLPIWGSEHKEGLSAEDVAVIDECNRLTRYLQLWEHAFEDKHAVSSPVNFRAYL